MVTSETWSQGHGLGFVEVTAAEVPEEAWFVAINTSEFCIQVEIHSYSYSSTQAHFPKDSRSCILHGIYA